MEENRAASRSLWIGLIALVVIVIAAVLVYPLLTDDDDVDTTVGDDVAELEQEAGEAVDAIESEVDDEIVEEVQVNELVAASEVDADNCATTTPDTFALDEQVYVVARGAEVPAASTMYVRVLRDDQQVIETQAIPVDQTASDGCIAFLLTPDNGEQFAPGEYEAQLFVNESEAATIAFEVEDDLALAQ